MIDSIISSKTRVKLLLKFFINEKVSSYLRGLAKEFGESTNSVRVELNRLESAGLLSSKLDGGKKMFSANKSHPFFEQINQMVIKHVGLDAVVFEVAEKLGDLKEVHLLGDLANGEDCDIIDLAFLGNLDRNYLVQLITKAENLSNKKIKYVVYENENTFFQMIDKLKEKSVLLWKN